MSETFSIESNQIHNLWQKLAEELLNIFDAHGVCAVVANETAVFSQTTTVIGVSDPQQKYFDVWVCDKDGRIQQIGLARIISDFATFAYISDVFILPDFQGKGLGKWLIECILAHPAFTTLRKFTLDTNDAHGLYAQFGFKIAPFPDNHMIYRPNEPKE